MSLEVREALIGLLAEDPAVLAAYVLGEQGSGGPGMPPTLVRQGQSLLQLGVLFRVPGTGRAVSPRDKVIRRMALARKTGELLGTPVEVVDLDNADRQQLRRAVLEGVLLYVRTGGETAHRAFEAYVRHGRYSKQISRPGGGPRRNSN